MTDPEQSTGKPSPRPESGFGAFLLKALVLFVVITAGVAIGFLIASHISKRDVAGQFDTQIADALNQTSLAVGDSLPDINVRDEGDSTLALTSLVRGRKAILAFVSEGCEPCGELLEFLKERCNRGKGRCEVVVLAVGVQGYEAQGFDVFSVDRPTTDELRINIFPTAIGLNPDGTIAFVSSGFSPLMTTPLIERHL